MDSNLQNVAKTDSCSPTPNRDAPEGALPSTRPVERIRKVVPTPSLGPLSPVDSPGELIITSIRATDVATGLRRIPVGFYTAVRHSGYEWRTANKPALLNQDAVEWSEPIPIPSDHFAKVCFGIYATFELEPTLGHGELLRELAIRGGELWNCDANELSFSFLDNGKVTSPCSSLSVILRERKCESGESFEARTLEPHRSMTEPLDHLEEATNHAHNAFLRYRRHGETQDLSRSIDLYELALDICPLDHPCRAVSQSNLATAKFFRCLDDDNDHSLDVPLILYRDALASRPVGHPDRPATLIQLATVLLSRFDERRQEFDATQAETFLREAINLTPAERYENKAAVALLQMHTGGTEGNDREIDQTSVEQMPTSAAVSINEDPWDYSNALLHRFEQLGDLADLELAISILERIVTSPLVLEDDQYSGGLTRLGGALLNRFLRLGELSDLEQAIARSTEAVKRTPPGHPNNSHYMSNLAIALKTRFERFGESRDLEQAISNLREAAVSTAGGCPDKLRILNSLANCFLTRFKRLGNLGDLADAISKQVEVVELTPDEHPDRPGRINNLANCFLARFQRLGELGDLDKAISMHKKAVAITRNGSPDKPSYLSNHGASLLTRFQRVDEIGNLEDAILSFREAVELTPTGHPDEPGYLAGLALAFEISFKSNSNPVDLERAISGYRKAMELTPDGHDAKPGRMTNLGHTLTTRFQLSGHFSDLEEATSKHKEAIYLLSEHHSVMPDCLNNLACSLGARYEQLDKLDDLEEMVSTYRKAIQLVPDNHPRKPTFLRNLGDAILTRFERLGERGDLEEAISRLRNSNELTPDGHVNKSACLRSLGTSLLTRFNRLGELEDCEEAISMLREADKAATDGHVDKPGHINDLGNAVYARFNRLGELSDLEEAISSYSRAVELVPDSHVNKSTHLMNLGTSLLSRFERVGKLEDLEEGISKFRKGADLSNNGHAGKPPAYLNDLGNALRTRFEQLGELSDIEEAISMLKKVTEVTPNAHAEKPVYLNNLGAAFVARFERLGQPQDIEEALLRIREAAELTPDDHPSKPTRLNDLGSCLDARFEQLGQLSDLEEAISLLKRAIALAPDDHPDKPACLTNFGSSLRKRFELLGEISGLEEAISSHRKSVELTPSKHREKPSRLSNLAISLGTRFEHNKDRADLDERISKMKEAVELTPRGHSDKPAYLNNLAAAFRVRFDLFGDSSDVEQAILQYSRAASASTGPTLVRFHASQGWISCARSCGHSSLLDAYSVTIDLLPQLAWIGLSLTHRYNQLARGANVVREAAAAALDAGQPKTAVEWLEQGRSIVWGELFQLRSSYEELASAYPDHASQLRKLSVALERASSTRDRLMSVLVERKSHAERRLEVTLEQEAEKQRTFAIERDRLLQVIRGLPGFERFLLHKEFSWLRASAHSGPVVILNAGEKRCDALVVLADREDVIHVPLPNFTRTRSGALQNAVGTLLGNARDGEIRDRASQRVRWESVLSTLWRGVVKPVLDALSISAQATGGLSRIFWCPTGHFTFLPIHAAGLYGSRFSEPGYKISDFVISSYVPSLSILSPLPNIDVAPVRFLAVHQPQSDGQSRLPGVHVELDHIRSIIRNSDPRITLLESSTGTVEEVLRLMQDANWVHFACHGVQDPENATESGLCLADRRRLKVSDMLSLSRPRGTGGLAFLSACQTAMGEAKLSDEAIHIAAGMLFAGYGGVIGTLWSIGDGVAPRVAKDVYEQLFREGRVVDHRGAARALHDAVQRLQENNASFVEWLPFIHVGL